MYDENHPPTLDEYVDDTLYMNDTTNVNDELYYDEHRYDDSNQYETHERSPKYDCKSDCGVKLATCWLRKH